MVEQQELERAMVLIAERVPSLAPRVRRFLDNLSDQPRSRRLLRAECILKDALNVSDFQLANEEPDDLATRLATASAFTADEIEELLTCLTIVRYQRLQAARERWLSVRLGLDEYDQVSDEARQSGFNTVAEYVRSRLLQQKEEAMPDLEMKELERVLTLIAERAPSLAPRVQRFLGRGIGRRYFWDLLVADTIAHEALNTARAKFSDSELADLRSHLAIVQHELERIARGT
jgi:hypothetical protein